MRNRTLRERALARENAELKRLLSWASRKLADQQKVIDYQNFALAEYGSVMYPARPNGA